MARIDLNPIGTIEYPYIQAWGKILGSFPGYIADEIGRARADGAPKNAIYKQSGGEREWVTADSIKSPETKKKVEKIVHKIQYRYMYDRVIASGDYHGQEARTAGLAQLIFALGYDDVENKDAAVWVALETYEEMTGCFWDPTQDEFERMKDSII